MHVSAVATTKVGGCACPSYISLTAIVVAILAAGVVQYLLKYAEPALNLPIPLQRQSLGLSGW